MTSLEKIWASHMLVALGLCAALPEPSALDRLSSSATMAVGIGVATIWASLILSWTEQVKCLN